MDLFVLTVLTYNRTDTFGIPEVVFVHGDWHDVLGVFADMERAKLTADARCRALTWERQGNLHIARGQIGFQSVEFLIMPVRLNTVRIDVDKVLQSYFDEAMTIGSERVQ
jgi:hypothetical protein